MAPGNCQLSSVDGDPRTTLEPIRLGFSTCPNDTFMFHGLVHGQVPGCGFPLAVHMDDIEALNRRCLGETGEAKLTISKVSAGVLPWLTQDFTVLRSGAALGRGCGPLVVVRETDACTDLRQLSGRRVAIPGARTTANLLLRLFGPPDLEPVAMRFDKILTAVAEGKVDAGLIIHESRFTYGKHGLRELSDLGTLWEADTGLPLPLGVIVAQRNMDAETLNTFEAGLSRSVAQALDNPAPSRHYIRQHAQEMNDRVCAQHIALYVNAYSVDMGDEGVRAIDTLLQRGAQAGALPPQKTSPWRLAPPTK